MNLKKKRFDKVGRRRRDVRTPAGETLRIQEREIIWAEICHRLGPQTVRTLHEYTKHLNSNYYAASRRAKKLCHEESLFRGEAIGGPFFSRPDWQFDTAKAEANFLIVDVTEHSLAVLEKLGKLRKHTPATSGSGKHDFMASHICASIDLACRAAGHRFIHQDEILAHADTEARFPTLINGEEVNLIPDRIFAIEYDRDGRKEYLAFALEADRRTEHNKGTDRKTFERNVLQYEQFIEQQPAAQPLWRQHRCWYDDARQPLCHQRGCQFYCCNEHFSRYGRYQPLGRLLCGRRDVPFNRREQPVDDLRLCYLLQFRQRRHRHHLALRQALRRRRRVHRWKRDGNRHTRDLRRHHD